VHCPSMKVSLKDPAGKTLTFTAPFRIGRTDDCEVCIKDDYVSRVHAEVALEEGAWRIRDLNSSNGLYVDGQRIEQVSITRPLSIRLGVKGPEISFDPQGADPPEPALKAIQAGVSYGESRVAVEAIPAKPSHSNTGSGTVLRRYVDHYFSKSADNAPAGEHTMYVRRAFAEVQKKQQRLYVQIVAAAALVAFLAGGYALYEHLQLRKQRALAEDLFYTMKSLDLDIGKLEKTVIASGNQQDMQVVRQDSARRREMQNAYDQYLASLHIYDRKMTERQRIILRVARIFGECELDMPPDFEAEVNKYIGYWQHSNRLAAAIRVAQEKGYNRTIPQELLAHGLPPQFFYLALQESNFDPYTSGPMTRSGIAKGMWQFVPETAIKYGLRVGPLADLRRPDPGDERDQYQKATKAAARYLKDLYTTDAQASGILVMACYNWGENQVLPLVRSMPPNPRERNFWRLLTHYRDRIPTETYDYVFYIFSAAVIGENPRLFGFDFDNPLSTDNQNVTGMNPATGRPLPD
jgi:membrane-bound lytic murein transglycosylase D